MAVKAKQSEDEAIRNLERAGEEEMAESEIVVGYREPSRNPFSVRLSAPLLERLERLAHQQHRKRGNLIQHILWEYVRAHAMEE